MKILLLTLNTLLQSDLVQYYKLMTLVWFVGIKWMTMAWYDRISILTLLCYKYNHHKVQSLITLGWRKLKFNANCEVFSSVAFKSCEGWRSYCTGWWFVYIIIYILLMFNSCIEQAILGCWRLDREIIACFVVMRFVSSLLLQELKRWG